MYEHVYFTEYHMKQKQMELEQSARLAWTMPRSQNSLLSRSFNRLKRSTMMETPPCCAAACC